MRPAERRGSAGRIASLFAPKEPIPRAAAFGARLVLPLGLAVPLGILMGSLRMADVSAHVAKDLLDVGYTLGASRVQVLARVLAPATLPGVMDGLRITLGWAWTYLVVAELLAANKGLGYLILSSMRGLFTERIFVGIVTIGLLGLLSDQLFKWLHRTLLPWSPKA